MILLGTRERRSRRRKVERERERGRKGRRDELNARNRHA